MENFDEKARAYALKNALSYNGKANHGAVISALFNEGLKKEDVKKYSKKINEIVSDVNSLDLEQQKNEFEVLKEVVSERKEREGLPELPNVPEKGVVMRFAPAPSGPLHIGNAISSMISSLYVKKYGGKFIVRIEDTNPESIVEGSYEKIKEDCDWLFGNVSDYIIQSERMDLYYGYAVGLIEEGNAYVCTCSPEDFKKLSSKKQECPCRKKSVKDNIKDWEKMISKKPDENFKQGEAVLRFKTSDEEGGIKHKNPALRDFPLARISETNHVKQGDKYRVWPLMNLSVIVDDLELGMTHIIRGKDHRDNAKRQEMIYRAIGKEDEYPWTFFMGRVKFTDMELSKRKLNAAINSNEFSGADDERLPTISSLRKRGYRPEAFAKFAEHRGLTEVDKVMSGKDFFEVLDTFNKESTQ